MTQLPALDAVLADPDRALRLLGRGPAHERCVYVVRAFLAGVRDHEAGHRPDSLFGWEGWGLAARRRGPEAFAAALAAAPERAPLLFVGAGWFDAMLGQPPDRCWQAGHPDAVWVGDGWGYCVGLLGRRVEAIDDEFVDQGQGRSLYFVHGGVPTAIARAIANLALSRQPLLWRGVGIASVVTDGLDEGTRSELRGHGGEHLRVGEQIGAGLIDQGSASLPNSLRP